MIKKIINTILMGEKQNLLKNNNNLLHKNDDPTFKKAISEPKQILKDLFNINKLLNIQEPISLRKRKTMSSNKNAKRITNIKYDRYIQNNIKINKKSCVKFKQRK